MCKTPLHNFLQALPKCEHHIHIEGALTPELLFKLAASNGITLPKEDTAFHSVASLYDRYNRFSGLGDFLHYYYIGMSALISSADFETLALDYFDHAAADGVLHAEVFFDPQAHLSRGVTYETILTGFKAAQAQAHEKFGITSELICCFLRHLPPADCLTTFQLPELQSDLRSGAVIGIGLDSSESGFPPKLFTDLYQQAGALGLKRTAHAGEEGPASYIRSAIDDLHVTRIDHGIRLRNDPALLKRVAEAGILLTVCPYSNLFLQAVTSISALPIREFLDAGVQFSLNSDDPAYFGNHYILSNYCAVQEAFNLTTEEWKGICQASIRGSWCDDERKKVLLGKLDAVLAEHREP